MGSVQIPTTAPGPQSQAWMARRQSAVPKGVANSTPISAAACAQLLREAV
jgi:hypothetical protein